MNKISPNHLLCARPGRMLNSLTRLARLVPSALFLAGATASALAAESKYYGVIDQYPITMTLSIEENGSVKGGYYYDRYKTAIELHGGIQGSNIHLESSAPKGRDEENFDGSFTTTVIAGHSNNAGAVIPNEIKGYWTHSGKKLPFTLTLGPYEDGKLTCEEMSSQPARIFSEAPDLGSGRGSPLEVDYQCPESLAEQPFLQNLKALSDAFRSEQGSHACTGTIVYVQWRYYHFQLLEAGFAPEVNLARIAAKDRARYRAATLDYLRYWSLESIYNLPYYHQYLQVMQQAENDLAAHYASRFGMDDSKAQAAAQAGVDLFLQRAAGAYPSSQDYTVAPLATLLFNDKPPALDTVQKLITDADQSARLQALNAALGLGLSTEIVETLLDSVKDLNQGDESPLFFAVHNPDNMRLLLSKGADVNYQNGFGKTALYYAIQFNLPESAQALLNAGAEVNHRYKSGPEVQYDCRYNITRTLRSPLMHAAQHADTAMLELLIKAGADPLLVDGLGDTALTYAEENDKPENAAYLKNLAAQSQASVNQ
ncbi:ankyrin repeat domain-containing protein [Hahella aquimaris]|uniref:ankyrin repeat domain-containing protein n=1 Tax=Hahella sp. HNIBRBA332 TaxID=3015983 RepID=UPI00273B580A|nr:ankyrin repeat domain-containing protein [Hahella sp. HNIBRBA332]WLQ15771.1 ankyrin repeat domain-containing protein [Hahella sp. HNIBRBA332]